MIVLDEDNKVANWLRSLEIEEIGIARIDLPTFEVAQGFDSELILIQDTVYHQLDKILQDKLSRSPAIIIFASTGGKVQYFLSNIMGVISQDTQAELIQNSIVFIEEQLKVNNILKSQLMTINQELIEAMGGMEKQLLRVKKNYERTAPKRVENFKGVSVLSKYAAGEDMGGEFFDILTSNGKLMLFMSATTSYLASSSILEFFSDLKQSGEVSAAAEKRFIAELRGEITKINANKTVPVKTQVLTMIIDMNELKCTGHCIGDFNVLYGTDTLAINTVRDLLDNNDNEASFSFELQRGQRLLINSPGFNQNWKTMSTQTDCSSLVNNNSIKALDILDELYFELKKDSKTGFLPNDSSSIMVEVNENVMVKI